MASIHFWYKLLHTQTTLCTKDMRKSNSIFEVDFIIVCLSFMLTLRKNNWKILKRFRFSRRISTLFFVLGVYEEFKLSFNI